MMATPAHVRLAHHMHSQGWHLIDAEADAQSPAEEERETTIAGMLELLECGTSDFIWCHPDGRREYSLVVVGLEPEETLADYSTGGEIDRWESGMR